MPHYIKHTPIRRRFNHREILVSSLNRVTVDRIKKSSPHVVRMSMQNNIMQQNKTLRKALLLPIKEAPPSHASTAPSSQPPLDISSTVTHLFSAKTKRLGNLTCKGTPPTQLSVQKHVLCPPPTTLRT